MLFFILEKLQIKGLYNIGLYFFIFLTISTTNAVSEEYLEHPVAILFDLEGEAKYTNGIIKIENPKNLILFESSELVLGNIKSGNILHFNDHKLLKLRSKIKLKITAKGIDTLIKRPTVETNLSNIGVDLISEYKSSLDYWKRFSNCRDCWSSIKSRKNIRIKSYNSVISKIAPFLVWQPFEDFSYCVEIEGMVFNKYSCEKFRCQLKVPIKQVFKTDNKVEYRIYVLNKEGLRINKSKIRTITLLDEKKENQLKEDIRMFEEYGGGGKNLLIGVKLARYKLFSASSQKYLQYLNENPKDLAINILLIKNYHILKLEIKNRNLVEETIEKLMDFGF